MDQIRKALRLPKEKYYETHLSLINCLLPVKMTPKEIETVAAFMGLEGDIAQYRFGPSAKKIVMSQLQLSPAGLSNFIRQLTEKGFLIKRGDVTTILPLLVPNPDEQVYLVKLQNLSYATPNP